MLTIKDIILDTDPKLRVKAQEVPLPLASEDKQLLHNLFEYIVQSNIKEIADKHNLRPAVGLAAPQLGISKKMFAVHFQDIDGTEYSYKLVNPKIISHSVELTYLQGGEGCLSVERKVEGIVPRFARIRLRGFDEDGNQIELRLKGFPAVVFQHELDHLNGVLFYDHIHKGNPFSIPDGAKPVQRTAKTEE